MLKRLLTIATMWVASACFFAVHAQGWEGEAVESGGDYYLLNVESGYFLTAGNNWGTRCTLDTPGMIITPTESEGAYILSTAKNGTLAGVNYSGKSVGHNGYMDNGNNNAWTLEPVDGKSNVFYLYGNGNYLRYDGQTNSATVVDATANSTAEWMFISMGQIENHASKATMAQPVDMTYLIQGANFTPAPSNNRARIYTWPGSLAYNYDCAERYHAAFDAYQELTVPNGKYDVSIQGYARLDSDGSEVLAVLYANNSSVKLPNIKSDAASAKYGVGSEKGSDTEGYWPDNMEAAHTYFTNGHYNNNKITLVVTDGKLKVGVKTTATNEWVLFDNMKLTYYGVDLTSLQDEIATLTSTASGLLGEAMNSDVKGALRNAVLTGNGYQQYLDITEENLNGVISMLNSSITDAEACIASYKQVAVINAKAALLDDAGQAAYAATLEAYNNGILEKDGEVAQAQTAFVTAVRAQGAGSDWTGLIINNSFEAGFSAGWTNQGMGIQNNNSLSMKHGNNYAEKWQPSGSFSVEQTVSELPEGLYRITVSALARGVSEASVNANGIKQPIEIADKCADYSVDVMVEDGGSITLGASAKGTGVGASWFAVDNFRLTYVAVGFPEVASVTGVMNKEVSEAQATAVAAYNANKTVDTYNAAVAAVAAAKQSVSDYKMAMEYVSAATEIISSTNIYTEEAYNAYSDVIKAAQEKYTNGTLVTADISTLKVNLTGPANYNKPANVMTAYVASAWSATNDVKVYTNDWSLEGGVAGNSGLATPFVENWVNNASKLANTTVSASLTGLSNGLYEFTALVRLTNTKEGDDAGFSGISFFANDEVVELTDGVPYPDGMLYHVSVSALVKEGELKMGYIVDNTNVSWVAMKNAYYEKKRDLTAEEQMVYASADEINALKEAIASAEAHEVGYLKGQYAPYNNAEALTKLAEAKQLDLTQPVSAEVVNNLCQALNTSLWTANTDELNAIQNGDFEASYAVKTGTGVSSDRAIYVPEGWTVDYTGNVNDMTILCSSDKSSGNFSSISVLENGANHTYLYRGKWGNNTNIEVYQNITLPAGAYTMSCDAWKSGLGGNGSIFVDGQTASLEGNEASWRPLSLTFVLENESTVKVGFKINHNSDGSEKFIGFDNFELLSYPAYTRTTATDKYGTICLPYAANVEGAVVYSAELGTDCVTLTEVTSMEAGVPYIYQATADAQTFTYASGSFVAAPVVAQPLVGVFESTLVPVGAYVMQTKSGVQKFYKVATENQPTLSANKCYVEASTSDVKSLSIGFDEETAISALDALTRGEAKIYDLNGRQLTKLQKGVNIVGGKKIVVK